MPDLYEDEVIANALGKLGAAVQALEGPMSVGYIAENQPHPNSLLQNIVELRKTMMNLQHQNAALTRWVKCMASRIPEDEYVAFRDEVVADMEANALTMIEAAKDRQAAKAQPKIIVPNPARNGG